MRAILQSVRAALATITMPRVEAIADLQITPACVECDNPAVWVGRYRTCRHSHIWCEAHRDESIRRHRAARQSAAPFLHDCCGTDNPSGIGWVRL